MRSPKTRRIYVPWKFEPEMWELHGKYVRLDGQTYILKEMKITGAEPIDVDLVESQVPEGETAKDVEHWMRR